MANLMHAWQIFNEYIKASKPKTIRTFYVPPAMYLQYAYECGLSNETGWKLFHNGIPVIEDPELEPGTVSAVIGIPNSIPEDICRDLDTHQEDEDDNQD